MSEAAPKNVARFLDWDTRFFGVRIATIECKAIGAADWRAQLERCRAERIQCLYVLMDAEDRTSARSTELEKAEPLDLRVSFERATLPLPEPGSTRARLRLARPEDTPVLSALARISHADSRFWKDSRFARERCAELYATWIERSIGGWAQAVFVAELDSAPVGYLSCNVRESDCVEMALMAVVENLRGEGIGRALTERAIVWAAELSLPYVRVVTQGKNGAATRLYDRFGFRIVRSQCWHHLWFEQA